MTTSSRAADSYLKDPLYQSAQSHLQRGVWPSAARDVAQLIERYPLAHELRSLRQEILLRAKIDREEDSERLFQAGRRIKTLTKRLAVAGVVTVVALVGIGAYSLWMDGRLDTVGQALEEQAQRMALSAQLRDAEALLRSGRAAGAEGLLQEIAAVDAGFPGLAAARDQAEEAEVLDYLYGEALALVRQEEWAVALAFLQEIQAQAPDYRDVPLQIATVEAKYQLAQIVAEADAEFQAERWGQAASRYETVRQSDPAFQAEAIEEQLFRSYVNAARAALLGQEDSLEALSAAEDYFRRALSLRPQDGEVKTERELARLYLQAQTEFTNRRWSEVIAGLEFVNRQDPDYAQGTARQTLYEAYVARGDGAMAGGAYEAALEDYQRAAVLADQDPEAVLRLYEAHIKVAEAHGAQRQYEAGVLHYRTAAEVGNLRSRGQEQSPALAAALTEAERYAAGGNFSVAFERYRQAVRIANWSRATVSHVVQPGDYLTMLASRYGSTVNAIVLANEIVDPNLIFPDDELLIPVLP